ncbi:MmgE/PrpD family protein [Chloroflexota bacterium]
MSISAIENNKAILALAAYVANVRYEQIPLQAAEVTKMDILDSLGVAMAASSTAPVCEKIAELAKEMGGKEESTIIGFGGKVPSYMAAFVNGALVHVLNYDDFCDPLIAHFGCSIFPAALATAERVGKVSGKEFITAYTASVDLQARLTRAIIAGAAPRDWYVYGWLTPQLFGYFGATAVAGRLLGLDKDQLLSAFGLAYSQAAGNKQPLIGGGADKGIYSSYPAKSGVLSALMAQKGIIGPADSLEGAAGLYNVYFQGEYDPTALTRDLGKSFEGAGFYQFPCCGSTHLYLEVTSQMVAEHNIKPEDVEAITVSVGPKIRALCEPLEIRRNPRMLAESQYSLPFIVATAIAKGKPRIENFINEGMKDPEVLSISNKVSYIPDPECDFQWGTGVTAAKIEIKLKDGRVLRSEKKGLRHGHPQRPISNEVLIEKFRECASYSVRPMPEENVEEIINMVGHLEEVDDVSQIVRLIS